MPEESPKCIPLCGNYINTPYGVRCLYLLNLEENKGKGLTIEHDSEPTSIGETCRHPNSLMEQGLEISAQRQPSYIDDRTRKRILKGIAGID
jgi:hypothetical protein